MMFNQFCCTLREQVPTVAAPRGEQLLGAASPSALPLYCTHTRAVIVEPRSHPALEPVVKHVCEKLNGLPITIVHGSANSDFAHALMERITCVDQVLELNAANLDYRTYSKLFVASEFWRKLGKDSDQVGM